MCICLRYYKSPFQKKNTSFILELLAASTVSLVPMCDAKKEKPFYCYDLKYPHKKTYITYA